MLATQAGRVVPAWPTELPPPTIFILTQAKESIVYLRKARTKRCRAAATAPCSLRLGVFLFSFNLIVVCVSPEPSRAVCAGDGPCIPVHSRTRSSWPPGGSHVVARSSSFTPRLPRREKEEAGCGVHVADGRTSARAVAIDGDTTHVSFTRWSSVW